jgi:hypothetical protein
VLKERTTLPGKNGEDYALFTIIEEGTGAERKVSGAGGHLPSSFCPLAPRFRFAFVALRFAAPVPILQVLLRDTGERYGAIGIGSSLLVSVIDVRFTGNELCFFCHLKFPPSKITHHAARVRKQAAVVTAARTAKNRSPFSEFPSGGSLSRSLL